jgi:bacillithiol biosynthesis cysteine-adding enzyme BshC
VFEAYASGGARAFFSAHYASAEDRKKAVLRASRPLDQDVFSALEAQNRRYPASPERDRSLLALKNGAAAVVTGQQVGIFLGPLYTIYKAATAVRVARALAEESGKPVVPVFWLQCEDHDLVEIASCALPGPQGTPIALSVPANAADRVSISHRTLPPEINLCLETLRAELARLPHGETHLQRLSDNYREGRGYTEAFAAVLADLLEGTGIVFVDPRDPALATTEASKSVHRRALGEANTFSQVLLDRVRQLGDSGFAPMVHVRQGAPLSFFHPDGPEAPRFRLEAVEGGYKKVGGGDQLYTREFLLQTLEQNPLAFSTSALLRPVLQDTLLPTAAYVGGPGEIAYFAQLEPLYRAFGKVMPVIVPRARFRIVEEKTLRLLAKLGVSAEQATLSENALLAAAGKPARAPFQPDELEALLTEKIDQMLDEVGSKIEGLGGGLDSAIEKTRGAMHGAIGKLREKYERAVLHQDRSLVEDVQRLKAALHPNGEPQERVYGASYFLARYGERAFVERVLEAIVPFDAALLELRP